MEWDLKAVEDLSVIYLQPSSGHKVIYKYLLLPKDFTGMLLNVGIFITIKPYLL